MNHSSVQYQPPISLIINTTDRAASLSTLLRSLEHQSYPNFEVLVVVGPTQDNTLQILQEYEDRLDVLHCPHANLSQSRNIGLLAARAEIVAFIDDDAVPCHHWLLQIAERFQDPELAGCGGSVFLVHPNRSIIQHRIGIVSSLAEMVDVRESWAESIVPDAKHLGRLWIGRMMGANMAFRRQDLIDIGGFDEFYEWVYDDTDVSFRLRAAGKIVEPILNAPVYHIPASSRNRTVFTPYGRWWIQTKASLYFALKNHKTSGEPFANIGLRCLYTIHGHWQWGGQLRRDGLIDGKQLWSMRWSELKAAIQGLSAGLFRPRSLLAANTATKRTMQPIKPYLTQHSSHQPPVDPISGRQPILTMPEAPMRICLLSSSYPPDPSEGVGRSSHLLARGLFELGNTVHVIARGEREQVTVYDGAFVHRLAPRQDRYERFRNLPLLHASLNHSHNVHDAIQRLIRNDGIQVVDSPIWQLDGLVTSLMGNLPLVVRPTTAVKQVAQLQQMQHDDVRLVGEMEAELIQRASHVAANTKAMLAVLKDVYHLSIEATRSSVILYGSEVIDEQKIRPFDPSNPPSELTVLFVGRLEKRKGILDLFAAIPQVLAKVSSARFIIAGADNSISDGFQAKQGCDYPTYFNQQYAAQRNKVTFLGRVDEAQLQSLYQQCHLFVAPSLYESFGLIYLEAMNYAKPVIGCRAGGVPEVVEDGVTGVLVDPGAAQELAEAMIRLLTTPGKLFEMGMAGRQRLVRHFSYLEMARQFEKVYRTVIREQSQ